MNCPLHGELKISQKSGKPYCKDPHGNFCNAWRDSQPRQGGWPQVRQQVAQRVAPEKAVMTREDWEAKERRTNKNILLQVAFKAAVELECAGLLNPAKHTVESKTLELHTWLLSQTEGQSKPISQNLASGSPSSNEPPLEAYTADVEGISF